MNEDTRKAVALAIDGLSNVKFERDPLLTPSISRAVSIADSAKKRHGRIIEVALLSGLNEISGHKVWQPKDCLFIPEKADNLSSQSVGTYGMDGVTIDYTGVGRKVQIDMLSYDQEEGLLRAYEIKRGFGHYDAGKSRSLIRDLRCIRMVLRGYGEALLGHAVKASYAHILFWYGCRSIPKPLSIIGDEVDIHFGCSIKAVVDEATDVYRRKVMWLVNKEVVGR